MAGYSMAAPVTTANAGLLDNMNLCPESLIAGQSRFFQPAHTRIIFCQSLACFQQHHAKISVFVLYAPLQGTLTYRQMQGNGI